MARLRLCGGSSGLMPCFNGSCGPRGLGPPGPRPADQKPDRLASSSLLRRSLRLGSNSAATTPFSWQTPPHLPLRRPNAPSGADLERVQKFTREPILLDGETLEDLHPGTARRLAVDAALDEIDEGVEEPSTEVAPGLLAAARARAGPRRGASAAPRRRRALRASGRRALGHPRRRHLRDRGAGLEPERQRRRTARAARPPGTAPATRTTTRSPRTRSRRTGTSPAATRTRTTSSPRPPTTRTPAAASGSSTRPAPARRSPPSASSRRRGPAAS